MNRKLGWVVFALLIVVILVALVAVPLVLLSTVQRSADQVLAPLEQANQQLQTQVSELLHPTPTILPDPVTIINEVRSLARLETIQYTIEKVITAEIGQGQFGFLFGDRLLFVAHGSVIAGVDLAKMTPADLRLEGDVLHATLPQPEIFVATLDNDKSYVYDRETGILRREQVDLETQARQVAEQEIAKAALQDGILDTARINAETYLSSLFNSLGFSRVVFEYAGPTPTPLP